MTYIINFTNIPTEKHQYKITLEEKTFNKPVAKFLTYSRAERDSIIENLRNKYNVTHIAEFRY